jgi:hypothetical protein
MGNGFDYVQFGCGLCAPEGWANFDAGPSFWLQKYVPWSKPFLLRKGFPDYPTERIQFGNVTSGLPVPEQSAKGVYCSHVLEHLTLDDFRATLRNVFKYLEPGGRFRLVLPDLEFLARQYIADTSPDAASRFLEASYLGEPHTFRGVSAVLKALLGRSRHLWMWDYKAMAHELAIAGFVEIRRAAFNDSEDKRFLEVEEMGRWENCLGVECKKPGAKP